jgi:PAS domain S-box-containing protein
MKDRDHRRYILTLVWVLITIGLLAGVLTNGFMGWTLVNLNRERIHLLEQDRQLGQAAGRLQRLGQEARSEINWLLRGGVAEQAPPAASPAADFVAAVRDLRSWLEDYSAPAAFDDLESAAVELTVIRSRAQNWAQRYRPVAVDQQQRITLNHVRLLLEEMRAAAEILEGRQRLTEALALRQWRHADSRQAPVLAQSFLEQQLRRGPQMLKEARAELSELSRLVEILAAEDQLDHLADLRDNQFKQVLERLERQFLWLTSDDQEAETALGAEQVALLRDLIFGRGHAVLAEYQTIRPGEGGLFRLSSDILQLRREQESLQARAQELFARVENVYPLMADIASERSAALARQVEERLARGLSNMMLLTLLVTGGFLGLGWLISRRVENQVRTMTRLRRDNELILNSAGEGIIGLDEAGRVASVNPAGARLLGGSEEEIIGRCFENLLVQPAEGFSPCGRFSATLEQVLRQGLGIHGDDHDFCRMDGTTFPGRFTANPIYNEQSQIEGAVVSFRDVTERKQAAAALQRSLAELDKLNRSLEAKVAERTRDLEEKNRELLQAQEELVRREKLAAIGLLAAGVAHEINNPAAIIRGNVEILRRRLAGSEGEEEVLEVLKNTERISRITRSLLLFAREHEQSTTPPEEVSINDMLDEIIAQAEYQEPFTDLEVGRDFAPDLPPLLSDQEKLRQVFTNLVINAIQAMDGRGRLEISTRRAGEQLEVAIGDSGPGIPPEARQVVFSPFYTTKKGGTGMGLAVAYGIVQTLGGSIEVSGNGERGALITVRLPLTESSS